MKRLVAACVLVLSSVLPSACSTGPRALSWEAGFTDPAARSRVRALEVEIREGGCSGASLYEVAFDPAAPPPEMMPPELGPGTYGFAVAARDLDCAVFARGCEELTLPQPPGSTVRVTLAPFDGAPACAGAACENGLCVTGLDAGTGDAGGMDAGDAGPRDAGVAPCPTGRGDCNGDPSDGCETPLDRVTDCGACGAACAVPHATPECTAGSCAIAACEAGWADCNGMASDGCETSLRTTDDCGACGARCELANAAETCAELRCGIAECYPGFDDCDGSVGNGCETSLASATDCGGCGRACDAFAPLCGVDPAGARACVAFCAAPAPTRCGTSCFDTSSDPAACGACGAACLASHGAPACAAGVCTTGTCDPLWGDCNGAAADGCEQSLATLAVCGGCGSPCMAPGARTSCGDGTCVIDACPVGRGDCDGAVMNGCETDLAAPSTCGSCDRSCTGASPICGRAATGEATCLAACAPPAPDRCGDRCVDSAIDEANCGGCGLVCALPNAGATCEGGDCVVDGCASGFDDCDGVAGNGCEAVLASSTSHCGMCGRACPDPANAAPRCATGTCSFRCDGGFGDCDGDAANGCERSLTTLTDCGACGGACDPPNATGACGAGGCRVASCDAGFADCNGNPADGCEVDLRSDRFHCGGCGMRCTGAMNDCCGGMCGTCP